MMGVSVTINAMVYLSIVLVCIATISEGKHTRLNGTAIKSSQTHGAKGNLGNSTLQISENVPNRNLTTLDETQETHEKLKRSSRVKRAAVLSRSSSLWPDGVVLYTIQSGTSMNFRLKILKTMKHIESLVTCIQFVPFIPGQYDLNFVEINTTNIGCFSYSGMQGGAQELNLHEEWCDFQDMLHELMHVIGFIHEHTRPDRYKYINIITDNVESGMLDQFDTMPGGLVTSLGRPYDFDSIMHYPSNSFARSPGLRTIIAINDSMNYLLLGRAHDLSAEDVAAAKDLYKCTRCGGNFYHQHDFGKRRFGEISGKRYSQRSVVCEWNIAVAEGNRLRYRIVVLDMPQQPDCDLDYVIVRYGKMFENERYCGSEKPEEFFYTKGNRLQVILRLRAYERAYRTFTLQYELACGGTLVDDEGWIESPNFPYNYPVDMNCVWDIVVKEGMRVNIDFEFFDLSQCEYDVVKLYSGQRLMEEFSQNNIPKPPGTTEYQFGVGPSSYVSIPGYTTSGNTMRIRFTSGDFYKSESKCQGFSARYKAVADGSVNTAG